MKYILVILVSLFLATPVYAVSLQWDTVSTDVDGLPLSTGNQVTTYKLYGCQSSSCTLATATFVADVPAEVPQNPKRTVDISSQPKPRTYLVTAVNVSGESLGSNTVRVIPPNKIDTLVVTP
jgi:hypothetical protein